MNTRTLLSITGTFVLAACTPTTTMDHSAMGHGGMMMGDDTESASFLPADGQDVSSLPEATDTDVISVEDGDTIELNPTIVRKNINGKDIAMYGYNGQIPGPTLRVKQGSTFTVKVKNNIDLSTAIHWHGLRLDNASDGAVGMTQPPIEPDDSYTYTITVPDEGIYWYHPHVREDIQQDMGLYGLIQVTPEKADAYASVDEEQTVILDDILLDDDGMPVAYGSDAADRTLMGRFGNTFLVNGDTPRPVEAGLGTVVRFSMVNASNTRTYRLVQPQGSLLKIVGGDSGRYEKEFFTDSYILSPSERVIAEVYFWDDDVNTGNPATRTVTLVEADDPASPTPVLSATIVGGVIGEDRLTAFKTLRTHADVVQSIDPFRSSFDKEVDHTLALTMSMHGGMDSTGSPQMGGMNMAGAIPADGIEWEDAAMNEMPMGSMMQWRLVDTATGKSNKDLLWTAKVGDKLKIRIVNAKDSPHPMQHPIHFHGQRFLVLSDNGVKNDNLVWKDTTLVPAGHTVDILLDISNPGDWMFHCHIAEHLSNGMMGMLHVSP